MGSATSEVKVERGTADAAVGVAMLSVVDPTSSVSDLDSSSVVNASFKVSLSSAVLSNALLPMAPGTVEIDRGFVKDAEPLESDAAMSSAEEGEGLEEALVLSRMDVSTSEERDALDPESKVAGAESLTAESV